MRNADILEEVLGLYDDIESYQKKIDKLCAVAKNNGEDENGYLETILTYEINPIKE